MNYPDHLTPAFKSENIYWYLITTPIEGGGWLFTALDLNRRAPIDMEIFPQRPDAGVIRSKLQTMIRAAEERGQKPAGVQVEPDWMLEVLADFLPGLGVFPTKATNNARRSAARLFGGAAREAQTLMDAYGVSPQDAKGFFQAARSYYRAAPWNEIDEDDALEAQVDPPGWRRDIVLLGRNGKICGLLVYTDWERARQSLDDGSSPLDHLPEDGLLALTFEARTMLTETDRKIIRRYRLPVAAPGAYPLPMFLIGDEVQHPDHDSILFLEGILHALPEFVRHVLPDVIDGDETEAVAEYEVDAFAGTVRVTLAYPKSQIEGPEITAWGDSSIMSESDKQALALAHEAWQEADGDARLRLARRALDLSADAVEAYLTLAEEAEYPHEALEWLDRAVRAGERRLPADLDARPETNLWATRSTRPYLRALQAQGETLEMVGKGEAALQVYTKLLRLNPADHTGARYPALTLLLRLNRDGEARQLIDRYAEDDTPDWQYSSALALFRAEGDSTAARRTLQRAIRRNTFAATYLSGEKTLPADPDEAETRAEADAAAYALRSYPVWWSTPGAIQWLRRNRDQG